MRNDQYPPPNFRKNVNFEETKDDIGALSSIPPKVLTIRDVRSCYMCKIGEIGDFKIRTTYEKLCSNGVLRDKYKIIAKKRLTCALGFSKVFKVEWIKIVVNHVHDMKVWLEKGPIKIYKAIIC